MDIEVLEANVLWDPGEIASLFHPFGKGKGGGGDFCDILKSVL
jgi:hypothetical protein